MYQVFHKNIKQHNCFQHNVDNKKKCFLSRMISEWSCDTEDWSNDAENTALHHRNKFNFTVYSNRNSYF